MTIIVLAMAVCACGVAAVLDSVRRASAWHGARLSAVLANSAYGMAGLSAMLAPVLPISTWPGLLSALLLAAAGLWAVTGRAGRRP